LLSFALAAVAQDPEQIIKTIEGAQVSKRMGNEPVTLVAYKFGSGGMLRVRAIDGIDWK
jgi:hypothetical protein